MVVVVVVVFAGGRVVVVVLVVELVVVEVSVFSSELWGTVVVVVGVNTVTEYQSVYGPHCALSIWTQFELLSVPQLI